jgi:hypothetical protein
VIAPRSCDQPDPVTAREPGQLIPRPDGKAITEQPSPCVLAKYPPYLKGDLGRSSPGFGRTELGVLCRLRGGSGRGGQLAIAGCMSIFDVLPSVADTGRDRAVAGNSMLVELTLTPEGDERTVFG